MNLMISNQLAIVMGWGSFRNVGEERIVGRGNVTA